MQITLNQSEIENAIITFVGSQGIAITGKNVDVTLTAGRGPNGMSASIDISNDAAKPKKIIAEVAEEEMVIPEEETEEEEKQTPLFGH